MPIVSFYMPSNHPNPNPKRYKATPPSHHPVNQQLRLALHPSVHATSLSTPLSVIPNANPIQLNRRLPPSAAQRRVGCRLGLQLVEPNQLIGVDHPEGSTMSIQETLAPRVPTHSWLGASNIQIQGPLYRRGGRETQAHGPPMGYCFTDS